MPYRHSIDHCFDVHLGSHGITRARMEALLERISPTLSALQKRQDAVANPLLEVPLRDHDLVSIETLAADIRKRFRHVVVAGAGGSGLSGYTLAALSGFVASPTLHFLETIDPDAISMLLKQTGKDDTCFIVISKSGTTVETLGHFYVLLAQVKSLHGEKAAGERFIIITTEDHNPLHRAAKDHGMRVFAHDAIGGRFSILSNVGLLPAAVAGLDIRTIRKGAASVLMEMDTAKNPGDCRPAVGAALQYAFTEKGRNVSVMLPYAERLSGLSRWYRQSWAESLGKGGRGSTPIRAVGTTDQHSQLQLWLDGPKDKLFHLITVARAGTGQAIGATFEGELSYLTGKTTGDIMAAEQKATFETLLHNRCPVRRIELEKLGEEELGELLMHFILEIIFMAALLDVNPFDQPAVEEGKRLAREYLAAGTL